MTAEKKKYEFMRIIALDGSTIYRSKGLTALKDGKTNAHTFSGVLDDSLETIKLREIYSKHEAEIGYPYLEDKAFCRAIVSVSFNYAIKQYEKQGRRYVLYGQAVTDEEMTDHVCIRTIDGKTTLVAIETPLNQDRHYAPVEHPISAELLGKYFVYDAEKHEYKKSDKEMPSVVKKEKIREHLYLHGFDIDGIHYVRYKRSAGSSRDGRCLFIAEPLYADMMAWSACGLSADSVSDQASWQAYIALTLSSIESTIRLPKKAILTIPDKVSKFKTTAVCVKENKALGLTATEEETEIENVIWDGEALLDVSEFENAGYGDKGMMLLRNRFFKTCAFNTNLQKWFADNGITTVGQLAGYTTARKVEDIKLVITESSLKYLKFMPKGQSLKVSLEAWLDAVYGGKTTSEFGVVKTDKPPSNMEGRLAYTNYQLMNTLAITPSGMEQLLDASLYHLYKIYASAMHLRYQINYLSETEPDDLAVMTADNYRRKVVMEMLFRTPEFEHTDFYKDLKTDVCYYFKRRLKKGRVLVNGNNQTIFGNPYEFLCAVTDKSYEPTEPMLLGDGEVYTKRFEDGEMLTCARNPHITLGNILIGVNRRKEEIDTYFNLTRDIVCANAINSNLQQRLNGCDYDSDSMLVTNDQFLYLSAKTCYKNMGVPVCCVAPVGKAEYSSSAVDLARLDLAIAENKIGDIVNLSQFLNSLLWHNVNNGASINDILPIYNEICILAVLSGMEIDKAKRMYAVKTSKVLHRLEKRKQEFKKANGGKLPNFYYFITGQEEKIEKNNTATLNCPMSIIYDFVTKYEPYRLPKRKVKLSDLFALDESDSDSNDYHRKKNIIVAVQKAEDDIRHLRIRESQAQGDVKAIIRVEMQSILDECMKVVARNVSNDHVLGLLLRELDLGEKKEISQIKSFLFACLLFEKNGRLLSKVKTPEDYHYTELKLATDENIARGDMLEVIYGYDHVITVDGDTVLGGNGKIEIVDGKFIFYDANGKRVPIPILDY